MAKLTSEEIAQMLIRHKHWICEDCDGWEDMRAYLSGADLRGADLTGADLTGAYLRGAHLRDAKNVPFIPMACPDTGSFVGWKKADGGLIVKLLIPEDARRSSATGRKCRCDKAKVLAIENPDGTASSVTRVASIRELGFFYTVGETVEEPDYCTDRFKECAEGIHFFVNRQEAVDYYM